MVQTARARQLFLMEATWTRFLPAILRLRELLAAGVVGEVRMVQASFGFNAAIEEEDRLFSPRLGGGALLDVGVDPVALALMILSPPERVTGLAHLGPTGVDEESAMVLGHRGGGLALLASAIRVTTRLETTILGREGSIRIHLPWWQASRLTLSRPNRDDEVIDLPYDGSAISSRRPRFTAACERASWKATSCRSTRLSRLPARWMNFAGNGGSAIRWNSRRRGPSGWPGGPRGGLDDPSASERELP